MADGFDKWGRATSGGGGGGFDKWGRPVGGGGGSPTGGSGGGLFGGIEGIVGNALGQAGSIIHGVPNALVSTPHMLAHTFGPSGVREDTGISFIDAPLHAIGIGGGPGRKKAIDDPQNFFGVQAKQVRGDVMALRRGDWHYFEKNPLNPVLDVAAVASLGGKGALGLAGKGALGERAAAVANESRLLRVGSHAEELNAAKTLQGQVRQRVFDKFSQQHPDLPLVGAHARMQWILNRRAATMTVRAGLPVREFQRLTNGLKPEEVFAFHIAAEGVPLNDRISYYEGQLAEHRLTSGQTRTVEQYLNHLKAPGVRDALEHPRVEFVAALHAGKDLEMRAGERLVHTGQLSRATRINRAALPQDEMLGKAELITNPLNPVFPSPYRFPHVGGKALGGEAGLFVAPKTDRMLGKAAPLKQLRHNAAKRLRDATYHTDPARVLTTDYLQTMRHETLLQMQKEALDPISQPLLAEHVGTGFKQPHEWYYRPSYDRKTTAPVPRQVREAEGLSQDRAVMDTSLARTGAEQAAQGVVSKDLHHLGVGNHDLHNLAKLNELGIRRVPAAFGKNFSQEYGGTHWAVRYFYDRPLDVWRAITLNYRPAWMVNNFVGNGIMGLATHGPAGAAAYLRVLLSTERGPQKVRQLFGYTMSHPTLRRKYAKVFDEVAPELHGAGLYGTQTRVTNPGVYEGKLAGFAANPAVKALGFVPKTVGRGVMAVGRGVTKAEILFAEDTGREAAFIREAGGDLNRIRNAARSMGEANLSLADALKRLDRASVEHAVTRVNDSLGDFNDLSPFERRVVRRLIPFYSWFKVITKISGKYAARYPARVLLVKNIAAAQNQKGEPALPAWLAGAIRIGGAHNGVQTVLSTQGVNPYETIPQIASGGPGGVISPFLTAPIIGATGRDPTFGGLADYHGLGDTQRAGWPGFGERAGGSLISGLAPARLYTQTTEPYKGKAYAPKTYGHAGPVSLNDFLLQYLGIPIRHVRVPPGQ